MTKLQLAIDDISLEDSVNLVKKIEGYVDIVEVGTPLLIQYGLQAVEKLKSEFPHLEILCDTKIMDAGGYEAEIAFEAGGDYVTVLGVTDNLTVKECVTKAKEYNKQVMVDMICVQNMSERLLALEELDIDVFAVHTGVDQQANGRTPLDDLKLMSDTIKNTAIAVAGGVNTKNIDSYMAYQPEIVIVGSGITKALDPLKETKKLSDSIKVGGGK